jgi:hypothetical protein
MLLAMSTSDTFEPSVRIDADEGAHVLRKRRALYTTVSVLLVVVIALAVLDGLDVFDAYGVDSEHVRAEAHGYSLDVQYPTVSRPGLASPFTITVRRAGGFDQQVRVAIDRDYLAIWDENGVGPEPDSQAGTREAVVWQFDPPDDDVIVIDFDARIEPATQRSHSGRVALLDDAGQEIVAVDLSTRVLP